MKKSVRIFDVFVAILFSILLLIPAIVISILIKLTSEGPVLFIQERVGHKEKIFKIYKFRTMEVGKSKHGSITVGNDDRITKIGKILRKTKLDEIPQLVNILRGEMSFVGFRPDTPDFTKYYKEKNKKFFDLMPGITGKSSIYLRTIEVRMEKIDDPKRYYIEKIIPMKVRLNEYHFAHNDVYSNIKIMLETVIKLIIK
ncbi:hypothetical protein HMPREF9942_01333 [Fusobacterium animalis F0419]|uniref:Bacterial sugar transferase domain-containing protein n=1 Tax=Fusobacterium animalis F0419 TaxID=999414 RepID=H1HFT2_9FUSO|nr:sugar transferase [Fusobacterium animalis]EHO77605.1 hypothetical protein HMPREF9942_01333 [Fusobacterium animalis F0419]